MFKRLFAVIHAALTGKAETPSTPMADRVEPDRVGDRGVQEPVSPSDGDGSPSRERIAVHAYDLWVTRGQPIGTDWEDWFEAERQINPTA